MIVPVKLTMNSTVITVAQTNQDKTRRGQTPCTIIQDIDDFIAVYDPGKHVFLYIGQPENVTDSP